MAGCIARRGRAAPDRARAEQAMAESVRLGQEIAFNPELARAYVSYARLLQGWGENGQARSFFTQVIAMFQAMDMAWDLARAEDMLASGSLAGYERGIDVGRSVCRGA